MSVDAMMSVETAESLGQFLIEISEKVKKEQEEEE